MSGLIPLFSARARLVLFCFAFLLLSSPPDSWAQDRPTEGRELRWGEPAWGRLSGAERAPGQDREMQYWALEALAGETASIRLESGDFAARLYVLGSGLRESIRDRDDVGRVKAELTVTFPETGTYFVGVEAYGRQPTGSYSLTVTEPSER